MRKILVEIEADANHCHANRCRHLQMSAPAGGGDPKYWCTLFSRYLTKANDRAYIANRCKECIDAELLV